MSTRPDWVPPGVPKESLAIQTTIDKKAQQLPKYKLCDEQWLAIQIGHEDGDHMDLSSGPSAMPFSLLFDRVFLVPG